MLPKASLQIRLLGGFELRLASDTLLEIPTRKAQCLLAYLALHPGESQSREKLVGLFWGDSEEKRAQHNLRQALTYLRKHLQSIEPPPLSSDRNGVQLSPGSIEVDVLQFLQLHASGRPQDLESAIGLYRGELLEGMAIKESEFQNWLETERRHLREVFCQGLSSLIEDKRQSGFTAEAVQLAQRLLALDPLQERVHRTLMGLYGKLGMREAALKQYGHCRDVLARDLGVEPESETEALYESFRVGTEAETTDLGSIEIPDPNPVRTDLKPPPPVYGSIRLRQRLGFSAAAIIALVLIALTAWFRPWEPDVEPASIARMAFPLPDRPSIAVLPFDNLSDDAEQDYFADGITDDLITDLSKVPGLFVIARNSTFVYKEKDVPIRQVAEELGVLYVLEGSVRRAGDQVRINAQLIDATSGGHLWAERYDGPMTDVLAFQDQVTRQVARALEVELTKAEDARIARQETSSPEAYDAVLRALEHYRRYSKEDFAIAIPYLEKAIRLDPDYARAHTVLGAILSEISSNEWERSFDTSRDEVLEKSRHHLQLGMAVPSSRGHLIRSFAHSNEGRYEEAIAEAEKMIVLNENDVRGHLALGRALNKAGRAPEGIEPLRKALRLDPRGDDNGWISYRLGESFYLSEDYQEAAERFSISVEKNYNEWTYLFLAASLAQLGQSEEAGTALANFDRIRAEAGEDPYTVARVENWAFKNQADRARVQEGLRKSGMPEGATTELDLGLAQDVTPKEVAGASTVDSAQARLLFERGIKLIDVRDRADWAEGHIPGTLHLYLYDKFTDAKLSAIVAKDEEVVLYAEGTQASKMAAIAAARAVSWGFEKVYYFREGFPGWKAAGYPTKVVRSQ